MVRTLPRSLLACAPLGSQLFLLLAGLLVMAFAPPARGVMLLVPLTGEARDHVAALAVKRGALLMGRGPLEGSLIVRGERASIGRALLADGVLPVAAPAIWCGSIQNEDAS